MTMRISLFGALRIERDGRLLPERQLRSRQERRLLSALLVGRGSSITNQRLIEWIWPQLEHDTALTTLRSSVSHLRRVLAMPQAIQTQPGGYAWNMQSGVWVDYHAFCSLLEPLGQQGHHHDLEQALLLYRGDLLADEPDARWVLAARDQAREQFLQASERLCRHALETGQYQHAARLAQRALDYDPLREPICRLLMQAHAVAGDIAAALQAYEHFRLILDHELAASPTAATQQLHTAILRGELHLPIEANSGSALRLRPRAPARSRMAAPLPPLVGREQELAQLRAWVAALLRREGGVITLVGEAGIGKSRLVAELQQLAERQGVQILRINCRPTEQNLPLGALSETLRPLIRQAPMPLLRRLPALALAQFAERVPLLRERLPDLPALPPLPADEHRARVVDATAELALAMARLAPLLVCIDDAQSADATLLAVVGRLARQIAHRSVLVVLAYRADEVTENPHLHALLRELGREMLIRPLLIGPLDPQAAQQLLVGEASQPRSDRLIERLVEQSTGNPLMLLVATQALLDVHGVRTIAALPADLEVLPLPDLVRAAPIRELVMARVDRLPEAARTLLEQVALLGRPVSLDLIEQLGGPEPLVTAQFLLDRHLLVEGLAERLDLPHDLLRATVLSLIGAPKRRLLHRQIGYALIALHGQRPERAAEIGQHLLRAGLGHEQALQQQAQLAYQYAQQIHADDQARFWAEILQRLDSRRLV